MNRSGKTLVAVTAVTLGASMTLSAGASGSDLWADNGRIIYISCDMGVCDPYTSKDDGTGEKPTVDNDAFEDTPTISDDGKRIAFRYFQDIIVAKSDGTGGHNITDTGGVSEKEPDISPDGNSIVYYSSDGPDGDIVRSKIDGSSVTPVLDSADDDKSPEWSPDGKRIAFTRDDGSFSDVYTVKKDGSGLKQVTDTPTESEVNPSWSPDGERIAFIQSADIGAKLRTVAATGGPMKTVHTDLFAPSVPSWSPDGKRLAFFATKNAQSDVFTIKLNGDGRRNITDDEQQDFFYD